MRVWSVWPGSPGLGAGARARVTRVELELKWDWAEDGEEPLEPREGGGGMSQPSSLLDVLRAAPPAALHRNVPLPGLRRRRALYRQTHAAREPGPTRFPGEDGSFLGSFISKRHL